MNCTICQTETDYLVAKDGRAPRAICISCIVKDKPVIVRSIEPLGDVVHVLRLVPLLGGDGDDDVQALRTEWMFAKNALKMALWVYLSDQVTTRYPDAFSVTLSNQGLVSVGMLDGKNVTPEGLAVDDCIKEVLKLENAVLDAPQTRQIVR